MTKNAVPSRRTSECLLVCALVLATALVVPPPPVAARIIPPPVPADIQVPAGNKPYLVTRAVGTQDYVCLPNGAGFAWTLFAPRATLFNKNDKQLVTHFVSPNPTEASIVRSTWQHSADTSTVWGRPIGISSDPAFVSLEAVPWLLYQTSGTQNGPTKGRKLVRTTYIQRLNTSGGLSSITGCSSSGSVGAHQHAPYEADYYFYKED